MKKVYKITWLDITNYSGWNDVKDIKPIKAETYGIIVETQNHYGIDFYVVNYSLTEDKDGSYELIPVDIVIDKKVIGRVK